MGKGTQTGIPQTREQAGQSGFRIQDNHAAASATADIIYILQQQKLETNHEHHEQSTGHRATEPTDTGRPADQTYNKFKFKIKLQHLGCTEQKRGSSLRVSGIDLRMEGSTTREGRKEPNARRNGVIYKKRTDTDSTDEMR